MNGFEVQITPSKLHLFQRELEFVSRVYWKDSLIATYGERENDLITAAVTVNFPCIGNEYRIIGYVNHKNDLTVAPLHLEQVLDMSERIKSRMCDLLGKRQSRNETWVLVDGDGQMLCCGPAGAMKYEVDRYHLDVAAGWLRQVAGMMNHNWGASVTVTLTDYLAVVHASIRERGFIPKSMRDSKMLRDEGLQPTYFHAFLAVYSQPKAGPMDLDEPIVLDVTDNDRAVAAKVVEYVRGWNMDDYRHDEFKKLLFKAAAENVLQQGIEAATAFAVVEYLQSQSKHLTDTSGIVEVHLTPIMKTWLKKGGVMYKFVTPENHVLVWFADRYSEWMKPGMYRVRVNKLDTFAGVAQTIVDVLDVVELYRQLWSLDTEQDGATWRFIIRKKGNEVRSSDFVYEEVSRAREVGHKVMERFINGGW